jgi:hypothetical protein
MHTRAGNRYVVAIVASLAWIGMGFVPSTARAAGNPEVVHGQFAGVTGADLGVVNICGDLADFNFVTDGSFTSVEMGDGVFHFQIVARGTYTVTFLDTTKGVWEATIRSVTSVQATAGGTFVLAQVANTFEGPVRIHEQTNFVVGADGTVRADHFAFDFVGCPAA